jgi:hypothetical protein
MTVHPVNSRSNSSASLQDLCGGFTEAGFNLQTSLRPDSNQLLLRILPAETRLAVQRRVLVMSYNNVGNYGDRLGFHDLLARFSASGANLIIIDDV